MPYDELKGWYEYFDRRPPGWQDDDRTSKLLQAQGVKEDPKRLFPSLKKIYDPDNKYKDVDPALASFQGSWFQKLMREAVGGDKINI